jgi:hypothetical protein
VTLFLIFPNLTYIFIVLAFFVYVGIMILSVRKGKESGLTEKYPYKVENIEVKRLYCIFGG